VLRRYPARDLIEIVLLDQIEPPARVMLPLEMAYLRYVVLMANWSGQGRRPKLEDVLIEWSKEPEPKKTMTAEDWAAHAAMVGQALGIGPPPNRDT